EVDDEPTPGCWIVFGDRATFAEGVVQRLRAGGHAVAAVARGDAYDARGDDYTIRADRASDYDELLESLIANGRQPTAIAHLWSAVTPLPGDIDGPAFDEDQEAGFHSLVLLAQALERVGLTDALDLNVACCGVSRVL